MEVHQHAHHKGMKNWKPGFLKYLMLYLAFVLAVCFFSSCSSNSKAPKQDIDAVMLGGFSDDTASIAPGTEVQMLALSGSRSNDEQTIFYSQIIVQNKKTGDTVCILCPMMKVAPATANDVESIVMPGDFNPDKGVLDAVFLRPDMVSNMMLQISSDISTNADYQDTAMGISYLNDKMRKKEMVIVNRTLPIFLHRYPTVKGILRFSGDIR